MVAENGEFHGITAATTPTGSRRTPRCARVLPDPATPACARPGVAAPGPVVIRLTLAATLAATVVTAPTQRPPGVLPAGAAFPDGRQHSAADRSRLRQAASRAAVILRSIAPTAGLG